MYLVGLTGGIGSGKSSVAARLAELGCEIVDADRIARELVVPGEPALDEIVARFGEDVRQADGSLDRSALASIVFGDPSARAALDRITHPRIAARIAERVASLAAAETPPTLVVVDHPLLVETRGAGRFDAVVVVEAPAEDRVARLVENRGMDAQDVRARMAVQAGDDERRAVATHVIVNDGDLDALRARVDEVHRQLVGAALAAEG